MTAVTGVAAILAMAVAARSGGTGDGGSDKSSSVTGENCSVRSGDTGDGGSCTYRWYRLGRQ